LQHFHIKNKKSGLSRSFSDYLPQPQPPPLAEQVQTMQLQPGFPQLQV
jgi:hypothetical protein